MNPERVLLTALGAPERGYRQRTYRFKRNACATRFAPVAIAQLRPDLRGARAAVLVTARAREAHFEEVAAELSAAGVRAEAIDIPEVTSEEDIFETFRRVLDATSDAKKLTLDITLGLRHHGFVFFASLMFLQRLHGAILDGVYYGAEQLSNKDEVPLVDLTPLMRLVDWSFALDKAIRAGDFRDLAGALEGEVKVLFTSGQGEVALSRAAKSARRLARALAAGLPLDVGIEAKNFLDILGAVGPGGSALAHAARLVLRKLEEAVRPWATEAGAKFEIGLTREELARELRLARWYLERENLHTALLVLREWMVNLAQHIHAPKGGWLDYGRTRHPAEILLQGLSERAKEGLAAVVEKEAGSLWEKLSTHRNAYAHAGMKPENVDVSADVVREILTICERLLETPPPSLAGERPRGVLLLTALGLSPGVLFSAVRHIWPQRLVVITSAQASPLISEALGRAGAPDLPHEIVALEDPHQGFVEGARIERDQRLRRAIAESSKLVVNITGGTTAMQYVVDRLARLASRLGTPVRRIALVDRRAPEVQRVDPYVLGDLVELDAEAPPESTSETSDSSP
jgi:hypothetical protein